MHGDHTAPSRTPTASCPDRAGPLHPIDPGVGAARQRRSDAGKHGLRARHEQDRPEHHHDHGGGPVDRFAVDAGQMAEGGHADSDDGERQGQPDGQHQRTRSAALERRRDDDGQQRQDAGIDEGQDARDVGPEVRHGSGRGRSGGLGGFDRPGMAAGPVMVGYGRDAGAVTAPP